MRYCPCCEAVEPDTNLDEETGDETCAECGGNELENVPEHDDGDLDR